MPWAVLAAAVIAGAAGCGPGPVWDGGPCAGCNVVLISIETLRPDHMSLYGYERETTPNIDRFFADRAVFGNASSSAPCTVPSVKRFLSGDFDARNPRLAEVLFREGYQTAAVVSQHIFRWRGEINEYRAGFQHWDIQPLHQHDHHHLTTRTATEVTNRAISWLKNHADQGKFFLWLHYFDPHDPYEPPVEFRRWPVSASGYRDGDRRAHLKRAGRKAGRRWNYEGGIFSAADVDHFIGLYDAEILYTDLEVGRVLDTLEALGLARDSIVVLTSDHGEHLGEDDIWDHCVTVQEVETRVPLALNLPRDALPEDYLRHGPVSTLDLYPTILRALGIHPGSAQLDGRDLRAAPAGRRAIASFRGEVTIKDERWKLYTTRQGASYQPLALYDLRSDPGERRDELGAHPEVRDALFRDMAGYLDLVDERERADREIVERLKALGYTD